MCPIHNESYFFATNTSQPNDIVITFLTSESTIELAKIGVCVLLFIIFVLPLIGIMTFFLVFYGGSNLVYRYHRLKYRLKHGKTGIDQDKARKAMFEWYYWVAKIWFGFRIIGFENLPIEPCMVVSTHGTVPVFGPPTACEWEKKRGTPIEAIIDKKFFETLKEQATLLHFGAWSKEESVQILKNGSDFFVSPGGQLEVRFSDENYKLTWGDRKGYARVATEANAPIVPLITVNLNEAFWVPFFMKPLLHGRFAPKSLYFAVVWGGLPVRLTTIIGKPIPYDASQSVEEIADRVKKAIEQLRDANQRIPGSKLQALLDRFRKIKYITDIDYVL